jgi:hypothetical protein
MPALFQAINQIQVDGIVFNMPEGPAFNTRQEAEAWLATSDLGSQFQVQEIQPFAL